MTRPVKPGDSIREHLTATWFNEINKSRTGAQPNHLHPPENPVRVQVLAGPGQSFNRFEAACPIIEPTSLSPEVAYSSLTCKVTSSLNANRWGILQGPCSADTPAYLTVLGLTWALFDYTENDTHVDVVGGNLISGSEGRGIIIAPPLDENSPGLILLGSGGSGGGDSGGIVARTITGISSRIGSSPPYEWGFGQIELIDPSTGELYDPTQETYVMNSTSQTTTSGQVIQAKKIGGAYFWDVEDCQVPSNS